MTAQDQIARIGDLALIAKKRGVSAGSFLTPAEQISVKPSAENAARASAADFFFFGGPADAERKIAVFISDRSAFDDGATSEDIAAEFIEIVRVTGSGYEPLNHSSYLGAILALGIERDAVGDITVLEKEAYVVCRAPIGAFIARTLLTVGRDTVSTALVGLSEIPERVRNFALFTDTVASARLDCVVSSLCNLSRSGAEEKILSGAVALNYAETDKRTTVINQGDVISIRGTGKFIIDGISEPTKKGRLKLQARKYL